MSCFLATQCEDPWQFCRIIRSRDSYLKIMIGYVNGFRYRLYRAQKLSKKTLASSQTKMKTLYDRQTVWRTFLPGDKVLVLLPFTGCPFKARYSGPHTVMEKLSDQNYIIATPGRRTRKQLSHVNLLKPYFLYAEVGSGQEAGTPGASPACVTTSGFSHIGAELGEEGLFNQIQMKRCCVDSWRILSHYITWMCCWDILIWLKKPNQSDREYGGGIRKKKH